MSVPTQFPPIFLAARPGTEMPGLTPGQTLSARVLGPGANGATLVQAGSQQLALQLPTPLAAGTVLHLRVEARGSDQRLMLLQSSLPLTTAAPKQMQAGAALPQSVPQGQGAPPGMTAGGTAVLATADPLRAALVQVVQTALGRQGSLAALMETIAALGPTAARLPEPVRRVVARLAEGPLRMDGAQVTGRALQQAVQGSGLFMEAALARGGRMLPAGDLKGQLLELTQALRAWLGADVPSAVPVRPPPPPLRGIPPRAPHSPAPPAPPPGTPEETGQKLLDQAEAALSRVRLMQNASLPEEMGRAGTAPAEWNLDLPFVFNGHFGAMPLQIRRDEANGGAPGERSWKVRFAVNLGESGEVGAQIGLRGHSVSVMLWATDAEVAGAMERAMPELAGMLGEAGLSAGTLVCRPGPPEAPSRPSGGLVDAVS